MLALETGSFAEFTDFWRLPVRGGGPVVASLIEADGPSSNLKSALVRLVPNSPQALYHLDDGTRVFVALHRMDRPPDALETLGAVTDDSGRTASWIMRDPERRVVYVPFSPSEAIASLHLERYARPKGAVGRRRGLGVYYAVKPFVPRRAMLALRSRVARAQRRRVSFPRWPAEPGLDDLQRSLLGWLLGVARVDEIPFVWFWPEGRDACVVLTHDVEGPSGIGNMERFISAESDMGFRSSFNVVPFKYVVEGSVPDWLRASGSEVGVHGYNHDGKLFSDWETFSERFDEIDRVAEEWGAVGFRAAATHRNPDWMHRFAFAYDSSFPDTDPFEPVPGGCASLFPFRIGNVIELPITMPQDHTLYALLGEKDCGVWRDKAAFLRARHGLVCVLTHPDDGLGYAGSDDVFPHYAELLGTLADERLWNPLPSQAASWWRARTSARVVLETDGGLEGPPGSTRGTARLEGERLSLEPVASKTGSSRAGAGVYAAKR